MSQTPPPNTFGNSPYQSPKFGAPQPQRSSTTKILLWVLGIFGGLGLLSCGCCTGIFYFGMSVLSNEVETEFGSHPLVVEKIGTVSSISFNFSATGALGEDNLLLFDMVGDKGQAKIICDSDEFGESNASPQRSAIFIHGSERYIIYENGEYENE